MRDLETLDSELRLLVAIRRLVREEEGLHRTLGASVELLDERATTARVGVMTLDSTCGTVAARL